MQTFAPLPDPADSAAALDLRRLGKQIIEAQQISKALADPAYGWQHHPAVTMWRGHLGGLIVYSAAMHAEWAARRGKEHLAFANMMAWHGLAYAMVITQDEVSIDVDLPDDGILPAWWGADAVHLSHRSNLIRKDAAFYGALWPGVPSDLPYVWPA